MKAKMSVEQILDGYDDKAALAEASDRIDAMLFVLPATYYLASLHHLG